MEVDKDSKVILLPSDKQEFTIIRLLKLGAKSKHPVLWTGSEFYELKEVTGYNPFLATENRRPILKNGTAVKSLILESDDIGSVIQSPNLLVSTPFNIIYYLIDVIFAYEDKFNTRFSTYDDFTDALVELIDDPSNTQWVNKTDLSGTLKSICETLNENGQTFYKFSVDKVLKHLNDKINKVFAFLTREGTTNSITSKVKQDLYDEKDQIPTDILQLNTLRYAIDMVFESYFSSGKLKEKFIAFNNIEFAKLDNYIQDLARKKKDISVVELNMNMVVKSSSAAKKTTKKVIVKKKVTKVAVGRGALDGFFKKA